QQADLQVSQLLRDRKEQTLGYQPKTPIAATEVAKPSKKSYAKIPQTPLEPPAKASIEPQTIVLPYGPLGPEKMFTDGQPAPNLQLGFQAAQRQVRDRLQYGPLISDANRTRMDLFTSLKYAVQHSRNYQSQMEDLYLSALDVTLQRHLFEPRPFVTQSVNFDGGQKDVAYRSALSATTTAGVRQQLPYGGEVVAQGLVTFIDALNDNSEGGENASAVLSASIPLLRGAGMVNLEPLIQSERDLVYQVRSFENFRRNFVVQIASAYFQLLTSYQIINNQRVQYEQAVQLVERNLELFAAGGGRVTYLAVQQSLTQQVSAEADLISAQQSLEAALDNFKLLIGMPVDEDLMIVPVELDVSIPNVDDPHMGDMAQTYRLDLQTARDRIEDAKRKVDVSKNGLLPDLDLTARGEAANRPDASATQIDSRSLSYSAGATLSLPIDRVQERNQYRSSLINFERAQRDYVDLSQNVLGDVRQAARSVQQAQQQLEIAKRGIRVAQDQLEYSTELFTQGKASTRDITDAQRAILEAQNRFDRARADLQINVLRFLRDTGTLRVDPSAGALGLALDVVPAYIGKPIEDVPLKG
ncbi:MAG TPA: TolC family protein, partial [Tepidisphaeraceae bacterium]|nr:TolC family protein [Tepidisphaeraceae bacterium]